MMTVTVERLIPEEIKFQFERAVVDEVGEGDITATFIDDSGNKTGIWVRMGVLPGVNPQKILGKPIMVLTDEAGFCYGAHLVRGEVIADSVDTKYIPSYWNFDKNRVRDILYGTE